MGGTWQAHPQEPPEVYSNLLPPSVGKTTGGKHPKAPQVNVPYLGWKIAGTSAGATGGILKSTPAVEAIAPQVVFQMASVLPSSVQQPPEVYSNLLPPSVGETTGGIHPMPSGINISAPPEVNIPKAPQVDVSTAGKHRPARTEDRR